MSSTPNVIAAEQENLLQRLKNACAATLFLLIQSSPKVLNLYRNEQSWTLFRVALGCFGAALVILPLSLWHGYFTAIFGLLFFVVSILLPPAELESSTDRKARELGARTVVSGGEFQPDNAPAASVQLFISPSQTWAMNKHHEPLMVITTAEIAELDVIPNENHWLLIVRWGDHKAEFLYKGIFAERFARLAEESLRQACLATQPPPIKAHAASA
jgi:hypothetical protein